MVLLRTNHWRILALCLVVGVDAAFSATPTDAQGVFLRGDRNQDAKIDSSDAIFGLIFLFLGGEEPTFLAACDRDNDARANFSDSILTLTHLFLGGFDPPPPHPDEGVDPNPDSLYTLERIRFSSQQPAYREQPKRRSQSTEKTQTTRQSSAQTE